MPTRPRRDWRTNRVGTHLPSPFGSRRRFSSRGLDREREGTRAPVTHVGAPAPRQQYLLAQCASCLCRQFGRASQDQGCGVSVVAPARSRSPSRCPWVSPRELHLRIEAAEDCRIEADLINSDDATDSSA